MFQSAMFMELLQQFCKAAHQNSKDKGFWDEAVEEYRGVDAAPLVRTNDTESPNYTTLIVKKRPINYGEKYLLMVSEILEMFEAYRKGKLTDRCDKPAYVVDPTDTTPTRIRCQACNGKGVVSSTHSTYTTTTTSHMTYPADCPTCAGTAFVTVTGVRPLTNEEEELADICIRIADYCGYRNIDLGAAILAKMDYNATRPHMHGGKLC